MASYSRENTHHKRRALGMRWACDTRKSTGRFRITLDNAADMLAKPAGNMRHLRIRVVPGYRTRVSLAPYGLTHGLIVCRYREPPHTGST